ncbi:MAG: hypothetical protein ACLPJJ_08535, partial [Acidocella sp.]|uniref:hypothetical protein n=1 Tax=Acidocella sp. TaxID=50710 RepID=UPI003FD7F3EB
MRLNSGRRGAATRASFLRLTFALLMCSIGSTIGILNATPRDVKRQCGKRRVKSVISFELTQEQKLAQSMVQELAAAQLRPAARDADDREAIPSSILDQLWATGIVQS